MIQSTMGHKQSVDSRGKGRKNPGSSSMVQKHSGGAIISGPSLFDNLPEDCISNIISFTSPRDACVAASVSKTFASAVKSDIVWEKFIPPEYESLISQSRAFKFLSKKELYFALCDKSVLIDDGKKVYLSLIWDFFFFESSNLVREL